VSGATRRATGVCAAALAAARSVAVSTKRRGVSVVGTAAIVGGRRREINHPDG
jgi:hypothetical protein